MLCVRVNSLRVCDMVVLVFIGLCVRVCVVLCCVVLCCVVLCCVVLCCVVLCVCGGVVLVFIGRVCVCVSLHVLRQFHHSHFVQGQMINVTAINDVPVLTDVRLRRPSSSPNAENNFDGCQPYRRDDFVTLTSPKNYIFRARSQLITDIGQNTFHVLSNSELHELVLHFFTR